MNITNLLENLINFYLNTKNNFRNIYQKSNLYDKKISKIYNDKFEYKPSPHLLSSIVKYQKKKYNIDDFTLDPIWTNNINFEAFILNRNIF